MESWDTFWATVCGALAGAVVGAAAAWLFSLDLRRRDRADRVREREEDRDLREREELLNEMMREEERSESANQREYERTLDAEERRVRAEAEERAREDDREFQRVEREEQEAFRERMRAEDREYENRIRHEAMIRTAWVEYAERLTDVFEANQKAGDIPLFQRAERQRTIVATLAVGEDAVISHCISNLLSDVQVPEPTRLVWLASAVLAWAYGRTTMDETVERITQVFDPEWKPYAATGTPTIPGRRPI